MRDALTVPAPPGLKGISIDTDAGRAPRHGAEIHVQEVFGAEALLLDVPAVARALGFSIYQARRFLAAPPSGFPPPLRVGSRIFVRRPQLEAWARGEVIAAPVAPAVLQPEPARRPRGRPRKSEVARGRS